MDKIYVSCSTNPDFNLALEEYLVKTHLKNSECLYLWQNSKTVVIGRNQNPWKECDLVYLEQINGKLVRRLSGGGAVYHDTGNLNFTYISDYKASAIENNIQSIVDALNNYDVNATFSGKNDIVVDSYKISGNAYYIDADVLCHHGTLLIDVDSSVLGRILTVSQSKLDSKGINSVKSRVKNLVQFNNEISVKGMKERLCESFMARNNQKLEIEEIDEANFPEEIDAAELFKIIGRYQDWDWNFGSSPKFNVHFSDRFSCGELDLYLSIEDGHILRLQISTDALDITLPSKIEKELLNSPYDEQVIRKTIEGILKKNK